MSTSNNRRCSNESGEGDCVDGRGSKAEDEDVAENERVRGGRRNIFSSGAPQSAPALSPASIVSCTALSVDSVNSPKRFHYGIMSSASESSCSSGRHSPNEFESNVRAKRTSSDSPIVNFHSHCVPRSCAAARRLRTISGSMAVEDHVVRWMGKVVYTAGRPSWFDCNGAPLHDPFIIGICGGSASGKTTVAERIIAALDIQWVTLLSMDSFYKVLTDEQHELAVQNLYDFDHPSAFDFDLLRATLQRLKEGKFVQVPIYNFATHRREKEYKTMYGAAVLIFEGILAFHVRDIVDVMDLKIFVDTDSDIRLARRLQRDVAERGRDVEGVLDQYNRYVKPAFDSFIAPTMRHADIIIPRGGDNTVAIDLIVRHIKSRLSERECNNRAKLVELGASVDDVAFKMPPSLHVLQQTPQVRGLHTFIRNKDTSRDEFIFYSSRLMRLLLEFALSFLPFENFSITSPEGSTEYSGKRRKDKVCGISILRAGETMEPALREVVKDCVTGKILIQTNDQTQEPELYYLRLPKDVHLYQVLLLDATVATGAAAMMAVRILLDHDVPQENISLVSLLMAETGIHSVAYAFPNVKLITTAVDSQISKHYHILPGIGNFGDRFFGTEIENRDPAKEDSIFDLSGDDEGGDDQDGEESGVSSSSKKS